MNEASTGGGLQLTGSLHSINNCVVAENMASRGPDVSEDRANLAGAHNLIGDGSDMHSLTDGTDGNMVGTAEAPIDPLLSNWTHFENGLWGRYPRPGSPVLDAGNNALAVDVDGVPLGEDILDHPRISDAAVDLGPVEGSATRLPQTYVVTSLSRTIDANDGDLTFFEALEAANRNEAVGNAPAGSFSDLDVIQFADGLRGTVLLDGEPVRIYGDLAIEGPGVDALTFDAQEASRVFQIGPGVDCWLSEMTVTRGKANEGAGVYSNLGTLTIRDAAIVDNHAAWAGGGGP